MGSLLFGNGTDIVRWRPNPQTRGTFDILTTCIITMLICVWTAVHLNVSPPGTVWEPRLRKVGWLILALLAPEMVAYTAWYQRQQALSTTHVVNKAYGLTEPLSRGQKIATAIRKALIKLKRVITRKQEPTRQPTLEAQKPALPEDRHPWTMSHGFYAVMGGIAFEISESESEKFLPSKTKKVWFMNDKGIHNLTRLEDGREIIPNLSEEEIKSKSKAGGLAKALVCIQALWFIAQCLTRLAQRIPISLLELNTFGHAVCALLIYLLWWEKPFEVDYPTMIEGQILLDFRALKQMHRNKSPIIDRYISAFFRDQPKGDWFKSSLKELLYEDELVDYNEAHTEYDSGQASTNYEAQSEQGTRHDEDNEMTPTLLGPDETLPDTGFKLKSSLPPLPKLVLTTSDVTRWKMASRLIERFKRIHIDIEDRSCNMIRRRCEDWPDVDQIFELPIALGFSVAALIYGGLHALAWSAHFGSFKEQLLWQISACVVMGGVPICYVINSFIVYYERHNSEMYRREPPKEKELWFRVRDKVYNFIERGFVVLYCLIPLAYILARAYLVVESFINLSHLPPRAYDLPEWSTYFPHIS